ncbi:MAG: hypothetical protein C4344_00825 [Acidimicrobiia bacterium]
MVRLLTVAGPFHARVVAARLGAEGILAELRGGLDGPYPMGTVDVWVPETDLDAARELLLADEIEAALAGDTEPEADLRAPPALWVLLAVLLLVALLTAAFAHR